MADYDFVPEGWGAHALPWIAALAAAYPALQEIRMKRMVVTDEGLELIGKKLKNFRVLVLHKCEGFSTHGLASIAVNCRNLRTLDLRESEVDDLGGNWISSFPDSYTALEFLNVDCLKSELHFSSLEHLVDRCPNLKTLRINRASPLENLQKLLHKAPQLIDLGMGSFTMEPSLESSTKLAGAFADCKGLKSVSGLWDANPYYLRAIYPVCSGLTSLNLRHTNLRCPDLVKLLCSCPKLQHLQVLDYIEDYGLEELAKSCKELQQLRLILSDPYTADPTINLTERGLISVSLGCPKLHSIRYFSTRMTNAALITVAKNKPNLTCFRLCILEPQLPDYITQQPLDEGFSAILERCKNLKRLLITGLVTDRLFEHIGIHGKNLEWLCLAFGGNSDQGLHQVLSGCSKIRKLMFRDCPFGGQVLLENSSRLEKMQSLWMSACPVSYGECKMLGEKNSRLNVEVINEKGPLHCMSDECLVENVYVYRTVAGPRLDIPEFVWSTNQKEPLELS